MDSERPTPILTVESLAAGYGSDWVVRHVSVQVGHGEIVTIIGPNGSGKSTLLKAVMGLVPSVEGSIVLDGVEMNGMRAEIRARGGIAYVPQEREVFRSLTVRENLLMGGSGLSRKAVKEAVAGIYEIYPILPPLESKLAGRLSGGERKTLAMARVMMASPRVVLLDEPTSNLAPIPSARLLEHDVQALAKTGVSVVLVEQRAVQAIAAADWVYVLVGGSVEAEGDPDHIGGRGDIGRMFLGATSRPAAGPDVDGEG